LQKLNLGSNGGEEEDGIKELTDLLASVNGIFLDDASDAILCLT